MSEFSLPSNCKIVSATYPITTNGTVTLDNICLKNAHKVWLVMQFCQAGAGHATTLTPKVGATDAGCTTAITFTAKWWRNADVSSTDTLTAQTAATTQACSSAGTNQMLVIEFDPADIQAQSSTYDWLGGTTATSSQGSNYVSATWFVQMRYQQATPPAVIS